MPEESVVDGIEMSIDGAMIVAQGTGPDSCTEDQYRTLNVVKLEVC